MKDNIDPNERAIQHGFCAEDFLYDRQHTGAMIDRLECVWKKLHVHRDQYYRYPPKFARTEKSIVTPDLAWEYHELFSKLGVAICDLETFAARFEEMRNRTNLQPSA